MSAAETTNIIPFPSEGDRIETGIVEAFTERAKAPGGGVPLPNVDGKAVEQEGDRPPLNADKHEPIDLNDPVFALLGAKWREIISADIYAADYNGDRGGAVPKRLITLNDELGHGRQPRRVRLRELRHDDGRR